MRRATSLKESIVGAMSSSTLNPKTRTKSANRRAKALQFFKRGTDQNENKKASTAADAGKTVGQAL